MTTPRQQAPNPLLWLCVLLSVPLVCLPIVLVCLSACADDNPAHGSEVAPLKIPKVTGTPERLALLVGIRRYAKAEGCDVPDLPGPLNDLQRVQQLLMHRFGFKKNDILVLRDEQATHRNIVDAFHRHLIKKAGKDTQVVFWFSGHGSQVQDRSKREKDSLDSTLLAYDSRSTAPDGSFDITDDELRSLLEVLPSNHITLVTDSCHSGDSFRNSGLPSRTVVRGTVPLRNEKVLEFWPKEIALLDDDDEKRRDISSRFVHISACTQSQLAHPWPVEEESGTIKHYGALTWFLCDTLHRARRDTSWREVVRRVRLLLSNHRPGQTPVHDGDVGRLVFGGGFKELPPGLPARVLEGNQLSIEAGAIHGLRQGSTVEIRRGSQKIGSATVTFVHRNGVRAIAEWSEARPENVSQTDLLEALETSRPANLPALKLHIADRELAARLAGQLASQRTGQPAGQRAGQRAGNTWVAPVQEARNADYHLDRGPDGKLRFRHGDMVLWPRDGKELQLSMLTKVFREELRYQAVMRLPLEPGGLKIAARFVEPLPSELDGSAFGEGPWNYSPASVREISGLDSPTTANQGHCYEARAASEGEYKTRVGNPPQGRLAVLQVTNRSDREVYICVLSLEETRRVDRLWPWPRHGKQTLKPRHSLRVPVITVANAEWTRRLRRPMRDRYVVIATTKAFDPEALIKSGNFDPTRSETVPLLLLQALAADNETRRGDQTVPAAELGWGSTWLDVHMAYEPLR